MVGYKSTRTALTLYYNWHRRSEDEGFLLAGRLNRYLKMTSRQEQLSATPSQLASNLNDDVPRAVPHISIYLDLLYCEAACILTPDFYKQHI